MRSVLHSLAWRAIRSGLYIGEFPALAKLREHAFLLKLLAALKVDCVVDVGANKGFFATHLRQGGFVGRILCFDPIAENCMEIRRRAKADPFWDVFQVALGADEGERAFHVIQSGPENVLSSFLQPKVIPTSHTEVVKMRRLDRILPEILPGLDGSRIFLKMDTQGFDLEVFQGCKGILGHIVGLQSEISVQPIYYGMPHYTDALRTYEAAGFSLMNFTVVNRTERGSILELDCVMARENAPPEAVAAL